MSFKQNEPLNKSNPENLSTEESPPLLTSVYHGTAINSTCKPIRRGKSLHNDWNSGGGRLLQILVLLAKKKKTSVLSANNRQSSLRQHSFMHAGLLCSAWFSILYAAICAVCIVERDGLRFLLAWVALGSYWTASFMRAFRFFKLRLAFKVLKEPDCQPRRRFLQEPALNEHRMFYN